MADKNQALELGELLSTTVNSVVLAQQQLDMYTEQRRQAYETAPKGSLAVPPIWYTFSNVAIEMELSASVTQLTDKKSGKQKAYILSRTLNPANVGLYGYQAAAGMRVRLQLAPQGIVPVKYQDIQKHNKDVEDKEQ